MVPESVFPLDILNCIALIALVVLKYPAFKFCCVASLFWRKFVLDNTYKTYLFKFVNLHPATDDVVFQFQGSTNGGSGYGVTITSTAFRAYHNEADSSAGLNYEGSNDLAQSTNFQYLMEGVGNDNDQAGSGELFLFNPSSTTFVKHFIARTQFYQKSDATQENDYGGYFNTTSAINAIQFKMSSGNIDSGRIALYGIK